MKNRFKPLATALAATLQLAFIGVAGLCARALHAGVPLAWDVVPTRAAPAKFDRYHGETLDLTATFRGFGALPFAPDADVRLYYQTNGMGSAWWSAPASVSSNVVTGTFSPDLDPGADSVTVFFGAPSNAYASAIIKLRPSPGFSPAAMPSPSEYSPYLPLTGGTMTGSIAFDGLGGISWGNSMLRSSGSEEEPWRLEIYDGYGHTLATLDDIPPTSLEPSTNYTDSATNSLSSVLRDIIAESSPGNYAAVSNAAMSAVQPESLAGKRDYADLSVYTNAWLLVKPDGNMVWLWLEPGYQNYWKSGGHGELILLATGNGWTFSPLDLRVGFITITGTPYDTSLEFNRELDGSLLTFRLFRGTRLALAEELIAATNSLSSVLRDTIAESAHSSANYTDAATNSLSSLIGALEYDISMGLDSVNNQLASKATTNDLADLRTESALVYRLYSGSNVVCEVTNYNSQVHAPTMRLMQLNESNEYVTVWAETNGLTRTLNAAKEYADGATNELKNVYAPRAWSRTTSGLGADAPPNTTWISTPRTVIAGGLEYAKIVDTYGEVWVLTSNGMAADFNPDTNAYFRITADDGTPVFSIEKSDAQVIGAHAEGITAGANSVEIIVPIVSGTAPTMFWRQSLDSGDWADESSPPTGATVNWQSDGNVWTCTVTFSGTRPSSMFFKFTFLQEGGVMIRNNATTDISAGIYVNGVKFVPSVSGNNLIWTKQ